MGQPAQNPYKVNNDKKLPAMSEKEYERALINVTNKLLEGEEILSREAALFFGKGVPQFMKDVVNDLLQVGKIVEPRKQFDRCFFTIDDITHMLCTYKPQKARLNYYTRLPMSHPKTVRPLIKAVTRLGL